MINKTGILFPFMAIVASACSGDMMIVKGDDCDADVWYLDADADGFGSSEAAASCEPMDGYVLQSGDCDDSNPAIAPNAIEVCNNLDDDCDTIVDNNLSDSKTWYLDADGDGYGSETEIIQSCEVEDGYVEEMGDCDDGNAEINPSATEVCDELDNDCDDIVDNDLGDIYYIDNDGDGFGDPSDTTLACSEPVGYSSNDLDCDDNNSNFTTSCLPIVVTEHACNGGTVYASTGPGTTEPELHILSAYEPTYSGQINVHIDRPTEMTLVLSSYEPVNWVVTIGPNTQVNKVLLNGYHSQMITIDSSIPVETRSYDQTSSDFGSSCGYSLPYNGGGCDTNMLLNGVTYYTGLNWTSFNGCYTAEQFLLE